MPVFARHDLNHHQHNGRDCHQQADDGRGSYANNVTEYSKELMAASFAAKWCPEYHVAVNQQYFGFKSPGILWDQKRFDEYTSAVMMQMRKKIDAIYPRVGHEEYCKGYIDFAKKHRMFYGMAVNSQPPGR